MAYLFFRKIVSIGTKVYFDETSFQPYSTDFVYPYLEENVYTASNSLQFKELLIALMSTLQEIELNAEQIGYGLYGLQNMSSDSVEVRELLVVLTDKIRKSEAELNAEQIGYGLYGLQNMSSNSVEVRELLVVLINKFQGVTLNSE